MTAAWRPLILWTGEVLRLLAGFGVLLQLARTVSPEALGSYLAIVAIVMVLPRMLDAGLPQALAYFLRARVDLGRSLLRVLAWHGLACVALACGLAWLLRFLPFDDLAVHDLAVRSWPVVGALVASETAALLALATLIPRNRYCGHVLATLAPTLLMLAAVTTCLILGCRPTPDQLLALLLGASLCGATLGWIGALSGWQSGGSGERLPADDLYRYGLSSYGTGVAKVAAQRFDRLYLSTAMGASGYAHYTLAVSIRDLAVFPANLHALTLRNRQMDLLSVHRDVPAARRLLWRVSAVWLAVGFAAAGLTWPLWPAIVELLFGQPRPDTAELAAILALSIGPMAVLGFSWNHLYALERPGRVTLLNTVGFVLLIPLFALAMSQAGAAHGAAIAAVAWSSLTAVASLVWALISRPPEAR